MSEIFVEPLESRIAPATITGKIATFTDLDGDVVQIAVTKGTFDASMFTFIGDDSGPQQLAKLDLSSAQFAGSGLTITITSKAGDGFVNIGEIDAHGNDLGKVAVQGDLLSIDAGDASPKKGIASINVHSFGASDPSLFAGLADTASSVVGKVGLLTVGADFKGSLSVTGGTAAGIGKISIGGSVSAIADHASGHISATGSIASISVVGSLDGSAATGDNEGSILSGGKIGAVSIGGSMVAGSHHNDGTIRAADSIGLVTIGGGIGKGPVEAGASSGSVISDNSSIKGVTIGGSLVGGAGASSGAVYAAYGIGKVFVTGGLTGAAGDSSGSITTLGGSIASVSIGGELKGDAGKYSGSVFAMKGMGSATTDGSLTGGAGDKSGSIIAGNSAGGGSSAHIGAVNIGGLLKGGAGDSSGSVIAWQGNVGAVKILNTASGQNGIEGGGDSYAGVIYASGTLGAVAVKGDIKGGTADITGAIVSLSQTGKLQSLILDGSLIGSDHTNTGLLFANNGFSSVDISGDIRGGNNVNSAVSSTGAILVGKLGTLHVGGDIVAGNRADTASGHTLYDSGSIRSNSSIGDVTIDGAIVGNATTAVLIAGRAQFGGSVTNNVAIGDVKVGEGVTYGLILAGVDRANPPAAWSPFARISSLTVGGDWISSSIAAGGKMGPTGWGAGDTVPPNPIPGLVIPPGNHSKIGKIVITGDVKVAEGDTGHQYGFVSGNFDSITVHGTQLSIPTAGNTTDVIAGGGVKIHRLP
jgi:hypothetical protein